MLTINDLSLHYGSKLLFDGVNLLLNRGHRYGIVGANGTGKSTLLRLVKGEEEPSLGEIMMPKGISVGWVKQDHFRYEADRVLDVVIQGKAALWDAMHEKEGLLAREDWTEAAVNRLGDLEEIIAHHEGYVASAKAHTVLTGLGIPLGDHDKRLGQLSGGYKIRVLLAQALFEAPEILLLDEPTNHLDIMTIRWLEEYLTENYRGLLLFVSHDRQFLKRVASDILDIDYGEIREYPGGYDRFLLKKAEVMGQKLQEKRAIEDKIEHMQKFVDRFKAKASKARQAASRMKMIDKLELPDIKHSSRVSPALSFSIRRPSGKEVVTIKNIKKIFGDRIVLKNVNLGVHRGEKVAIIGHNGIGKSTLLKIMMGALPMDEGEVVWGYETQTAYFAQDHHENLKEGGTVLNWLISRHSTRPETALRAVLGQVLFKKEDVEKDVLQLSGGEAAKLLLADIMLVQPNVLVLDEPTNHLDLESIEVFTDALKAYAGTVLLVSHDRYFVGSIATRVVAITERGMKDFHGTYREYLKHYQEDYLSQAFLSM